MSAGHNHSHVGSDGSPDQRRRLAIAFGVTATILVAQAIGAWWTGSLALLTDTAHMLVDVAGLLVALLAASMMLRPPSSTRTWGFRRIEVLAALGQAAVLLAVGVFAAIEGVRRLFDPPEVPSGELLVFGIIGLAGNAVSLIVLSSARSANLNLRAAFLEVMNDALGSVGVIVASIVIALTGWQQADAVVGLAIAALIVPRAVLLIREASRILMEFTPPGLDLDEVRDHMLSLSHVEEVHDLHASTVASGLPIISAHVVVADECFQDGHVPDILRELKTCAAEHFDVTLTHSTFQVEPSDLEEYEPNCHR